MNWSRRVRIIWYSDNIGSSTPNTMPGRPEVHSISSVMVIGWSLWNQDSYFSNCLQIYVWDYPYLPRYGQRRCLHKASNEGTEECSEAGLWSQPHLCLQLALSSISCWTWDRSCNLIYKGGVVLVPPHGYVWSRDEQCRLQSRRPALDRE